MGITQLMLAESSFGTLDWLAIAVYFSIMLAIVWWVVLQKQRTSTDYFLAGRNMPWFVIGASIFASNIGSEHIVGLAGQGSTSGMAMAHWELHAWVVVVLAWVFVPFYYRSKVFTMPEFLERRLFEKEEKAEEDRKFRNALFVITVTGGILAWIAWRILF